MYHYPIFVSQAKDSVFGSKADPLSEKDATVWMAEEADSVKEWTISMFSTEERILSVKVPQAKDLKELDIKSERKWRQYATHLNLAATADEEPLNKIQKAYIYTQLSNMHSHPTDCPTREKRGWTGDSQLTSGGAALNFDALTFYGTAFGTFFTACLTVPGVSSGRVIPPMRALPRRGRGHHALPAS